MSESRRSRVFINAFAYLLVALVPPLLILVGASIPEILDVMQNGICPGLPPDGGPYDCTVPGYIGRVLFGPYTLVLTVGMTLAWALAITMALGIYVLMKNVLTPPTKRAAEHRPVE